jgi:alpha-1,2-glucosyltransferase
MTWSFCVTKAVPFLSYFCRRHFIFVAASAVGLAGMVSAYTLAHPYLLADNRHYTFYIWRRIITVTDWSKFGLVLHKK